MTPDPAHLRSLSTVTDPDPLPTDPLGIALQSTAFLAIIVAAILTPAPVRAADAHA